MGERKEVVVHQEAEGASLKIEGHLWVFAVSSR